MAEDVEEVTEDHRLSVRLDAEDVKKLRTMAREESRRTGYNVDMGTLVRKFVRIGLSQSEGGEA